MAKMTEEDLMKRGDSLASKCAISKVPENQLAMVLAHLKRHGDPAATKLLLKELLRSPFAKRTQSTRDQLTNLESHVSAALTGISDSHDAAVVVGWAKRLTAVYKQRSA